MNTHERLRRMREVEALMVLMRKRGWRIESVEHRDEEHEPFRSIISVSVEQESSHTGIL